MVYRGVVRPIPPAVADEMRGVSWRDDSRCPRLAELALLELPHRDFFGGEQVGELVVARNVADAVLRVFARLWEVGFPIAQMRRIEAFAGDDERSMDANNSSGFNFRTVAGTDRLSDHALGLAIDINPVQNPWVRDGRVLPEAGRSYLDRSSGAQGMIVRPGPVTDVFDAIGWEWGGDWTAFRDYHHFSAKPT